jgi:hypothetical protein
MHLIEQIGTAHNVKKAFEVLVEVMRELQPLLEASDNKMETKKEEYKKKLLEFKKVLKTKHDFAIVEAQKEYELFRCFVVGKGKHNGISSCMKCIPRTPRLA